MKIKSKKTRTKGDAQQKRDNGGKSLSCTSNLVMIIVALVLVSVISLSFLTLSNIHLPDGLQVYMNKGSDGERKETSTSSSSSLLNPQAGLPPKDKVDTPSSSIVPTAVGTNLRSASNVAKETSNSNTKIDVPESKDDSKSIKRRRLEPSKPKVFVHKKPAGAFDFHFIHIPKCGGTSMTSILRKLACEMDPARNSDCCLNPGFCDWHAFRRCKSIAGCTNHIPQRPWIFKPPPSVTILREPQSRLLSAFFYRGHSPNNDFFQVRPYFKDIRDGKLPKVEFPEYIEMVEYQNIQTRMLGADSFPYRNVTITDKVFEDAIVALDNIFFVGVQEAYELSVSLFLREMNMSYLDIPIEKERDQSNAGVASKKEALRNNKKVMSRLHELNKYDDALYQTGLWKFCLTLRRHPDLFAQLSKQKNKNLCDEYV